jgi:hypothetical protein
VKSVLNHHKDFQSGQSHLILLKYCIIFHQEVSQLGVIIGHHISAANTTVQKSNANDIICKSMNFNNFIMWFFINIFFYKGLPFTKYTTNTVNQAMNKIIKMLLKIISLYISSNH